MSSENLVSIITPMYNAQSYIVETINSVINQTYTNWEMIIIDNCSTDNSREIVENINDSRIKLIKLSYNSGGPARPRNIGIDNAKGEYIAFLDADDVWLPNKLEVQIKYMVDENLDFSSTREIYIDEESKSLPKTKKDFLLQFLTRKHDFNAILLHNFIVNSSVIGKKDIFKKFRFDEDKMLIAIEDYYLWLELFMNNYKYAYLQESLVKYKIILNSAVDRTNKLKNQIRRNYVFSKLCVKYQSSVLLKHFYKITTIKYIISFWK
jgi:teichuronic acid biosynthesis glycosyltransferase TuaG